MPEIKTTTLRPNYLAHLALVYGLHTDGLLARELINLLKGTPHDVAMTFVDLVPVSICLYATYGQLMAYTVPEYRRQGLASRGARLLSRKTGIKLHQMTSEVGNDPNASKGFFKSLKVDYPE